ncbi:PH domain-containing protein [Erysipelotrichaceae bacterium HCN-30851]
MENKKIRNHISIVVERIGGIIGAILLFALTSMADEKKALLSGDSLLQDRISLILAIIIIAIILGVLIGFQLWRWSKTFIYIQDKSIVVEQHTLQKKKNTIGIKNISNVNTEQNLFEILVGTCKIKLDTNSLSTADETDVQIVLKKKEAEVFRNAIMRLMQEDNEKVIQEPAEDEFKWDIKAELPELLTHGLYSINILSLLLALSCGFGIVLSVIKTIQNGFANEGILGTMIGFITIFLVLAGSIWDIVKGFVKYLDFKIARREDKIYISYGIMKRVRYTIPVNKISALQFHQTIFARLTNRYMVKIINIGMGDNKEEAESFFLPYHKLPLLQQQLEKLLPEFYDGQEKELELQPAAVWFAWLYPFLLYVATILIIDYALWTMFSQYYAYIIIANIFIFIWGMILLVCYYKTTGYYLHEDYLVVANGYFSRTICFLPYANMQYIEWKQNVFAHFIGIYNGKIHLLASTMNNVKIIPYMYEKNIDLISERILKK